MKHWHALPATALLTLLAACGGGDGGGPDATPTVARVEIVQSAALLTQPGERRQLDAVAYDAEDRVIDAPITWHANTPAQISVDTGGAITALAATGSSLIVAEAGGVRSVPLLAVAAPLPPGTMTLTDAQIVGEPVATDPNAAPSFANTYRVVLRGVATPAVGQLLVNTESKPVGGRVVAVQPGADGQSTVTLRLASLREMFTRLDVRQTLDLANAPLAIDPQVAASYDVHRTGTTLRFTPRPGTFDALRRPALGERLTPRANDHRLGLFSSCETSLTGLDTLPIRLVQPPIFSLTNDLALDLVLTDAGLERLVARGGIGVAYDGTLEIAIAFEGSISCEKVIATIRVPIGGIFSLVVGGLVPVSLGLEASGKMTVASAKLGLKAEAAAEAELGMACPGGGHCEFVAGISGNAEAGPEYEAPAIDGNVRFEPELTVFAKLELAVGNPFLRAIRFNAFEASMGPKLAGSFAPHAHQIANADYKSSYGLTFDYKAGLGSSLDDALEMLGIDRIEALELSDSLELGRSPKGTVEADRLSFVDGDTVNFQITLDPATLDFVPLVVPDNVRDVVLMRKAPADQAPHEVARSRANPGQARFDFAFAATDAGSAAEFTAFVVTSLLPVDLFALEIGSATAHAVAIAMPWTIPSQGSTSATVTVTRTDEQGASAPTPDRFVALSSDCGSVSPANGRTDAQGRLAAQVTPAGCTTAIAVTAVASENEGTPALAHKTVTATVGPATELKTIGLYVGGRTPGRIDVWVYRSDDSQGIIGSVPIGDAGSVAALVDAALAGTSRLGNGVMVEVHEPVNLSLSLAIPVGNATIVGKTAAACASDIRLRVGEVHKSDSGGGDGSVGITGCLGHAALVTGDVGGQVVVRETDNTVVGVTTGRVTGIVSVGNWSGGLSSATTVDVRTQGHNGLAINRVENSTVTVLQGSIQRQPASQGLTGLWVTDSVNLSLVGPITGGDLDVLNIVGVWFSGGFSLDAITVGNIAGDLLLTGNHRGFSDSDASAFASARIVGGRISVSGNSP